jgi:hypothetical protein
VRRAATATAEPPELVHIGLAGNDRAGGIELPDYVRVVGRRKVGQHLRAAGGEPAVGAENVLVRDRHAGQRSALTVRKQAVGGARGGQGLFLVDTDEGVERLAQRLDSLEEKFRGLDAGESLGGEFGGQLLDGEIQHARRAP